MVSAKFQLGQIVTTRGVLELLDGPEIMNLLSRHASGDWGELCEEDKGLNEAALVSGDNRLFSAYETARGKVWIITEYDHSVTTVLLPSEY